ncbi:MAG: hypothetical protein IKK21_06870, partial [Clostridia bacterium]|nr:hypothetical protein [Clostridia bacterium]
AAEGFRCGEGDFAVEMPADFSPENLQDWVIVDGAAVYDPLPAPAEPVPLHQRMDEVEAAIMELAALIGGEAV